MAILLKDYTEKIPLYLMRVIGNVPKDRITAVSNNRIKKKKEIFVGNRTVVRIWRILAVTQLEQIVEKPEGKRQDPVKDVMFTSSQLLR